MVGNKKVARVTPARKNKRAAHKKKKTAKRKAPARLKPAGVRVDRTKSTAEVASIFSVINRTVQGWVRRGCPHDKGVGPVGNRFDESEVAAWLKSQHIDTCKPGRPIEGDSKDLQAARLRKENALAAKYELEVERIRKTLLDANEVKSAVLSLITVTRDKMLTLASSIAPLFPGIAAELEVEIHRRVKEHLFDLSNTEILRSRS